MKIILIVAGVLCVLIAAAVVTIYKMGKDETYLRPCGGRKARK